MAEIVGKVHLDTSEMDVATDKARQLVALLEEAKSLINDMASTELLDLNMQVKE